MKPEKIGCLLICFIQFDFSFHFRLIFNLRKEKAMKQMNKQIKQQSLTEVEEINNSAINVICRNCFDFWKRHSLIRKSNHQPTNWFAGLISFQDKLTEQIINKTKLKKNDMWLSERIIKFSEWYWLMKEQANNEG